MAISMYQQYDILKYLKSNAKVYTYETANYFGTGEDEFKDSCINHRKLFTPYIFFYPYIYTCTVWTIT